MDRGSDQEASQAVARAAVPAAQTAGQDTGRESALAGPWTPARAAGLAVGVAVAYGVFSEIAFRWFDANGANASFFPAAGVTMAALLLLDRRWWSSVAAGALVAEVVVDLVHDLSLAAALGYAGANLAQPLVGAVLLRSSIALGGFRLGDAVGDRCQRSGSICPSPRTFAPVSAISS